MKIIFTLHVPIRRYPAPLYALIRDIGRSKKAIDKATKLLGNHYHVFSDGTGCSVTVSIPDWPSELRQVRRDSKGFCGYDWMADSIWQHGGIIEPKRA